MLSPKTFTVDSGCRDCQKRLFPLHLISFRWLTVGWVFVRGRVQPRTCSDSDATSIPCTAPLQWDPRLARSYLLLIYSKVLKAGLRHMGDACNRELWRRELGQTDSGQMLPSRDTCFTKWLIRSDRGGDRSKVKHVFSLQLIHLQKRYLSAYIPWLLKMTSLDEMWSLLGVRILCYVNNDSFYKLPLSKQLLTTSRVIQEPSI